MNNIQHPHGKPNDDFDVLKYEEQNIEDLLETRYLTNENAVFKRTSGGFVSLDYNGTHYDRITVHRAFPFTDSDRFISIRESNPKAREIGIIEDLNKLDSDTRQMILEQINMRYFTPKILKINDIREEYGYTYFDVYTDHGECRFTVQMKSSAVTHLSDSRIIISDIDSNRFEISDINKLSSAERKKLDMYL